MPTEDIEYMRQAIQLARENVRQGGRPFGAVAVFEGRVIATAANETHTTQDPTAHAELLALRRASHQLQRPRLDGVVVYASGQPCPMCTAAMALSGVKSAFYGYTAADWAPFATPEPIAPGAADQVSPGAPLTVTQFRPEGETGLYEAWKAQT